MTTIVTRTSKGAPLTRAELDANFTNLNNDKVEKTQAEYTAPGSGSISVRVNPALNTITGGGVANTIAGGGTNTNPQVINSGGYNTISGGYDNQTAASSIGANTIGGGAHHRMGSGVTHGTIAGGSYSNITAGDYGTIGGGTGNTVSGSDGVVAGGINNTAGQDATVGGGSTSTASGRYSVVAGGTLNTASAEAAVIAGGAGCTAAGQFPAVGGGYQNNIAAGIANTVGGGYQNLISTATSTNYSTIGGGRGNSIQGGLYGCIPGGQSNSVTADYGVATGSYSRAYLRGMKAHSSASTTSQLSCVHLYRQTTTASEADLLLDGSGLNFVIADNTLASFTLHICAARTDVVGEYAWYQYRGVFKREATLGSVVLLSSTLVDSYETTSAWYTRLAANTNNGALRVIAAGEAGKTIRWSARLDMIEQKFA